MAAASTSHDRHQKQYLPPSPPPSPPSTRRRHKKKKSDPFENLATTPISSLPSSPASELEDDQDPLLKRIILTPLLFVSFLFSLFLVNQRDRARRTQAHSPDFSVLTYLMPASWLDPEPYQDPDDSTWDRKGVAGHVEPNDAIAPKSNEQEGEKKKKKRKSWHLHKKVRKMAKLEVGDALEMRGRIIVLMVTVMAVAAVTLWMIMRWLLVSLSNMLFGTKS